MSLLITNLSLSDCHLFFNIGHSEDDSVFNRTFTALVIVGILNRHNNTKEGLFSKEEICNINKALIRYLKQEKDVRGYVGTKGWAHSAAHTGDALAEVALCK